MTLPASPAAIARASDADYAACHPRMRAAIYITPHGLEYRSAVDHSNDR